MFTEGENHLMFDENKEKQFILQLFNLEYSDVQDVSCIRAGNTVIIDITLASDPVPCPVCGCDQPTSRTTSPRTLPTPFFPTGGALSDITHADMSVRYAERHTMNTIRLYSNQ